MENATVVAIDNTKQTSVNGVPMVSKCAWLSATM